MPNDPKFKTVSRVSKQHITAVISVYLHMLVIASMSEERGTLGSWNDEDIASSLDLETEAVISIREAMQGRLLDGDALTGWEKRQPLREDSSNNRVKSHRTSKKNDVKRSVTQCNADVTQCNAPDKDKDKDKDTDKDLNTNTLVELKPDNAVFEHWRNVMNHPKAVYDDERKRLIKSAMKMGYSEHQLCEAITGCSKTPHNMGKNDRGEIYDGLHIIFKSANQIERFIRNSKSPPRIQPQSKAVARRNASIQAIYNSIDSIDNVVGEIYGTK